MKGITYKATLRISQTVGTWFFVAVSKVIATAYLLLFPGRVRNSVRFYRSLIPGRKFPFYLLCTWKQYLRFTRVFLDRFVLLDKGNVTHTSKGWHYLEKSLQTKEGGIILMSHFGNWEIAAHLLKKRNPNLKLLLYLGMKHKEQIEKMQKESLQQSGTRIIAVDQDGGSPFLLLESIKWMNEGGLVSLTGDIIWNSAQRSVSVDFLDKKADLPETPHMLALLSGKPLFILFSVPIKKNHYQIQVSEPIYVTATTRKDRKAAVQKSAQFYADKLTEAIRQDPFEWFHFETFLK